MVSLITYFLVQGPEEPLLDAQMRKINHLIDKVYSLQLSSLLAFPALCVSWPRLGCPLSLHLSLPCNTIFVLVTCESKAWHCE